MAPLLKTENLCHIYGKDTPFETTAIDHVNFEAERGEVIGLIGHTGSGKSTFVQHLNGLLKPSSGRILLDGKDIWESKKNIREVRFRIGVVFQYPEHQLFEETVYKDIAFGPKNMRLSAEEVDLRVRESAGFVGLSDDMLEKSPFELSGGEKRRVAIAGVIVTQPEILVLDEPAAGLDPKGKREFIALLKSLHGNFIKTIIIVSHDMNLVADNCTRTAVFGDGKLLEVGTPKEISSSKENI